ncbi:GGDEF domain-containing protein [Dyella sp. 7MK23]|uniref:diguanylate cyclase n=2 Tax=Dyella acidiphila TaxID=2775866 RepID=A0ABR9GEL9_9GAMM|nr:GGDEF domain-containing protein [Dyella acidiphila]MBE1162478.1 GGDEF domain-containing protein [Dyella acidiphila]
MAWMLWFSLLHAGTGAPLHGAWREVARGDAPAQILNAFRHGTLKAFNPAMLQLFPRDAMGSWVVLQPEPSHTDEERVLSIYPAPLGAISLYDDQGAVRTLALDDFTAHLHGHGRLAFRLAVDRGQAVPILLKFEASGSMSAPERFELQNLDDFLQADANWLTFATACFAVMVAMALMALCFALMLRDMTFAWYTGYMLCYVIVQSVQTGFLFHPLGLSWLAGSELLVGISATALSVSFASLFVARFCDLPRYAPLLRAPVVALGIGMPLIVLLRCSQIAELVEMARVLVNPVLILGALLLLFSALIAGIRGSRPAWFFLLGWTPLLVLTAMTSAQVTGALPTLDWLNDASIGMGAFEAIVLSLGLADRALTMRRDRDSVRVLADRDALTNLFNRRAWTEAAHRMLAEGMEQNQPIALLFLDLDHFKVLNDRQGHAAGDRALVAVSEVLNNELRPNDLLGRYGGEEFVAMLYGVNEEQSLQVATRLCRRVHRLEIAVDQNDLLLSISIGLAMRSLGDTLESLIERADQAMYYVKLNGRNHVHAFERRAEMHGKYQRPHSNQGHGR